MVPVPRPLPAVRQIAALSSPSVMRNDVRQAMNDAFGRSAMPDLSREALDWALQHGRMGLRAQDILPDELAIARVLSAPERAQRAQLKADLRYGVDEHSSARAHVFKSAWHGYQGAVSGLVQELATLGGHRGLAQSMAQTRLEHQGAAQRHRERAIEKNRVLEWPQVLRSGPYESARREQLGPWAAAQEVGAFGLRLGEYVEGLLISSLPDIGIMVAGGLAGRGLALAAKAPAAAARAAVAGAAAVGVPVNTGRVLDEQREQSGHLQGAESTHLSSALGLGVVNAALNAAFGVEGALLRWHASGALAMGASEAAVEMAVSANERLGAKVAVDRLRYFDRELAHDLVAAGRDGLLMGWTLGGALQTARGLNAALSASVMDGAWPARPPRVVDVHGKILWQQAPVGGEWAARGDDGASGRPPQAQPTLRLVVDNTHLPIDPQTPLVHGPLRQRAVVGGDAPVADEAHGGGAGWSVVASGKQPGGPWDLLLGQSWSRTTTGREASDTPAPASHPSGANPANAQVLEMHRASLETQSVHALTNLSRYLQAHLAQSNAQLRAPYVLDKAAQEKSLIAIAAQLGVFYKDLPSALAESFGSEQAAMAYVDALVADKQAFVKNTVEGMIALTGSGQASRLAPLVDLLKPRSSIEAVAQSLKVEPEVLLGRMRQLAVELSGGNASVVPTDWPALRERLRQHLQLFTPFSQTLVHEVARIIEQPGLFILRARSLSQTAGLNTIKHLPDQTFDWLLAYHDQGYRALADDAQSAAQIQAQLDGVLAALGLRAWPEFALAYGPELAKLNVEVQAKQQKKLETQTAATQEPASTPPKPRAKPTEVAPLESLAPAPSPRPSADSLGAAAAIALGGVDALLVPNMNAEKLAVLSRQASVPQLQALYEAVSRESYVRAAALRAVVNTYHGGPGQLLHDLGAILATRRPKQVDERTRPTRSRRSGLPRQQATKEDSGHQQPAKKMRISARDALLAQADRLQAVNVSDLPNPQVAYLLHWVTQTLNAQFDAQLPVDATALPASVGTQQVYGRAVRRRLQVSHLFDEGLLAPVSGQAARAQASADPLYELLRGLHAQLMKARAGFLWPEGKHLSEHLRQGKDPRALVRSAPVEQELAAYQGELVRWLGLDGVSVDALAALSTSERTVLIRRLRETLGAGRLEPLVAQQADIKVSDDMVRTHAVAVERALGRDKLFDRLEALAQSPAARAWVLDPAQPNAALDQLQAVYERAQQLHQLGDPQAVMQSVQEWASRWGGDAGAAGRLRRADLYALSEGETVYLLRLIHGATTAAHTTRFDGEVKANWDQPITVGELARHIKQKLGFAHDFRWAIDIIRDDQRAKQWPESQAATLAQAREHMQAISEQLEQHLARLRRGDGEVVRLRAALDPDALSGQPVLTQRLADYGVTKKQATVLLLFLHGKNFAQISALMGIKPKTVEATYNDLRRTLGVTHPDVGAVLWQSAQAQPSLARLKSGQSIEVYGQALYDGLWGLLDDRQRLSVEQMLGGAQP